MDLTLRRRYAADYLALAYLLAYFAWLFARTPGTPTAALIGDIVFYPLGLAVGWAYLRNARLRALDRRTRIGWTLLGINALLLWVIGTTWPHLVGYFGPGAYPKWIGYLEIFQHVLLVAGLVAFPGRQLADRERARFRLDIGLVFIAGFVLAFNFGVRVSLSKPPVGPMEVAIAQSVLDWVVFVVAAAGVFYKRDAIVRGSLGCLVGASTLYLCANYVLASMPAYHLGDGVDGLWVAAWAFRWMAARTAWHRYQAGTPEGAAASGSRATEYQSTVFAYLLVAGAFLLLVGQVISGDRQFLGLLASCAVVMTGLLLARQVLQLRENEQLFAAQVSQEARFRALVQHSSDVFVIADTDGTAKYVSPAAERVFGPGTLRVGTQLRDLFSKDEGQFLSMEPVTAGDRVDGRAQLRLKTADGRLMEVEVVWSDLRHEPTVAGLVLNCRDVTERNELERQLRHAQKLDAVGHLAGGLAHDFNNVLTAIRGYTELLHDELPPGTAAGEDLGHIEQAVDRAAAVTRQLLAFSRRQAVQPVYLDLNRVLLDLRPLLKQLATDRIEVSLDTDPDLWTIRADRGQVEQVLLNLATNARDAMPNGGKLQVVTANRTIRASSAETGPLVPGDYVALLVSDQGTGMSEELKARIFEPFFSTKPKGQGTGLGLAMVHGIVTQAGGHVSVDTMPGRGTTFTILVPRVSEVDRATDIEPGLGQAAARQPGRTILLVDDEFGVRTIARRLLERGGHRVIEAGDGLEAMAVVADGVPLDLLITDLEMPGLHGRDLVARFRIERPGVPIICITGFAGEMGQEQRMEGVNIVLSKPFSSEVLLRAVHEVCQNAGAEEVPVPGPRKD